MHIFRCHRLLVFQHQFIRLITKRLVRSHTIPAHFFVLSLLFDVCLNEPSTTNYELFASATICFVSGDWFLCASLNASAASGFVFLKISLAKTISFKAFDFAFASCKNFAIRVAYTPPNSPAIAIPNSSVESAISHASGLWLDSLNRRRRQLLIRFTQYIFRRIRFRQFLRQSAIRHKRLALRLRQFRQFL